MNEIFEREYYLRTSDFDKNRRLLPSSLLDLFQDVAGAHAKVLGCGYDSLIKRSLVWVLVRVRYTLLSDVPMFSKITVRTWPLPPTRLGYTREYEILNAEGTAICKGSSEWVLMDINTRHLATAEDIYNLEHFHEVKNFPGRAVRTGRFTPDGAPYDVCPRFSHIDMNGHVNNTKYMNFVLDAAPPADTDRIRTVQIDYRKEVLPNDTVSVLSLREGQVLSARGEDKNGNVMFAAQVEFY